MGEITSEKPIYKGYNSILLGAHFVGMFLDTCSNARGGEVEFYPAFPHDLLRGTRKPSVHQTFQVPKMEESSAI